MKVGGWTGEKIYKFFTGEMDKNLLKDYLLSWIYIILRLGRKALFLTGLHGIGK